MTRTGKQEKYIRLGRIEEIKTQLESLDTRIIAAAEASRTALFPLGGDINEIELDIAISHINDLKEAMKKYRMLEKQLKKLEEQG